MRLPVMPPTSPMLAKLARELPSPRAGTIYEPKWDGFRAIVYRDGEEVELESRGEKSFTRYFPELLPAIREAFPERCVVDGEIVVAGPKGLDFNLLQQRIHPAASRVERLATETPASFVAFDLLALGDRDLRQEAFSERRRLLEEALADTGPPIHVTPATTDPAVAAGWLDRFVGAGLDGVVVKDSASKYHEGKRTMIKVKHERTADCVVAGYRRHKDGGGVGSLLLGLYDGRGNLHHVGVASGMAAALRSELHEAIAPYVMTATGDHPWARWEEAEAHERLLMPGTPSRWSGARDSGASWIPLRPELVAEVRYEHLQGARFRHPARFARWRPDRDAASCTYAQLVVAPPAELADVVS
ncbi:MAG: ATP-dependent DNA ligase [Actinobacteria bacterium]|nr:ATP-dependent DNA ligase [Actinomycetota bacterium]